MTEPEFLHGGFLLCEKLLSCVLVDVRAVGRRAECAARINDHEQTFAIKRKLKKEKKKQKYFEVVLSTFTAAATLTLRIRVKTNKANKKTFQSRPTACLESVLKRACNNYKRDQNYSSCIQGR